MKYYLAAKYYLHRLGGPITYSNYIGVARAKETIDFLKTTESRAIAEIGVFKGQTSIEFAQYLNGKGELHLFDFENSVKKVKSKLNEMGYTNVIAHPNSHKTMDSYNWSIMKLLQSHDQPIFDYVFIDGAHTWAIDALTFLLIDKLLKVGGYVDFDDYEWTMKDSPSMNPVSFPPVKKMYTDEQISTAQVGLIVDLLTRRDPRYTEVVRNKIFQKNRA
jgi:predicted O-methyltransferase YrrM